MPRHKHKWRRVMHMDGCHFYTWTYSCDCGASASSYAERNIETDPYSGVWMNTEGLVPDEEVCRRCVELMDGSKAERTSVTYFNKDGKITTRKFPNGRD